MSRRRRTPPRLLTIAGSDSGGGAGIQADLKTFAAHGGYGMSVVTAVTAQNTRAVTAVHEIPAEVVTAQIEVVFDDIGVDAVKIGMLSSATIVRAVAASLRRHAGPPVVLDPVMVAKSGDALLRDDAVAALAEELLPLATLVTPNLPEAERLAGHPLEDEASILEAARALARRGPAVLVKGGHGAGDEVVDRLFDGERFQVYRHPRLTTRSTHGTGCTLSSAIAARLGAGAALAPAVGGAIEYLRGALAAAYPLGHGHGPVDHLFEGRFEVRNSVLDGGRRAELGIHTRRHVT
ncbi:MAG: bifunctional hydroxymethylpyrimidine kinase/phosphomethylpyrimidine kinase [Acidobacteria bacterium]|nr:bifunctional hydroxymethylpyrimidine kinase/phosphomethylpyrimidine kinase [Acidobacteriota bacterium]